jgi:hypothetical protein
MHPDKRIRDYLFIIHANPYVNAPTRAVDVSSLHLRFISFPVLSYPYANLANESNDMHAMTLNFRCCLAPQIARFMMDSECIEVTAFGANNLGHEIKEGTYLRRGSIERLNTNFP